MVTNTQITWRGMSGQMYFYSAYPVNADWNDVPGNYIFAKYVKGSGWVALYVGETGSLRDRLTPFLGHEKAVCAHLNGITNILAHSSSSLEAVRRREEGDLISYYNPVCNE